VRDVAKSSFQQLVTSEANKFHPNARSSLTSPNLKR
jgi:hypothetical protein